MYSRKLRTIENLIMLTFPLVLFAGCAGSDVKPVTPEPEKSSMVEILPEEIVTPVQPVDSPTVTGIEPANQTDISGSTDETNLAEIPAQPAANEEVIDTASITLPEKLIFFFDTDIHRLSIEQRDQLKLHADYLVANPGAMLVINGHADERGTEQYNQTLSEKRAKATHSILLELGVPETQLMVKGFGEMVPMNQETSWDENRRVELQYTDAVMLSSM